MSRLEDGPLDRSRLADLIEFGRIVHAEMAALTTAAREGRAVGGGTLYTTTYPCHECARLIIAAGIAKVVYVDPYAKSLAPDLYADMWDDSGKDGRVKVEPFVGVSPRLFTRVFEMTNRAKDVQGNYAKWQSKALVTEDEEFSDSIPEKERAAGAYLKLLRDTRPLPGARGAPAEADAESRKAGASDGGTAAKRPAGRRPARRPRKR